MGRIAAGGPKMAIDREVKEDSSRPTENEADDFLAPWKDPRPSAKKSRAASEPWHVAWDFLDPLAVDIANDWRNCDALEAESYRNLGYNVIAIAEDCGAQVALADWCRARTWLDANNRGNVKAEIEAEATRFYEYCEANFAEDSLTDYEALVFGVEVVDKFVDWLENLSSALKTAFPRRTSQASVPGPSTAVRMTVEKWADLGIGIDQDGSYLAVSPCPDNYGIFPREAATVLALPGRHWRAILDLLAQSKEGNNARKAGLLKLLFPPKETNLSYDIYFAKTSLKRLSAAIANLSRRLRSEVHCLAKKPPPLSVADTDYVDAAFTVRHLVRGHDGKLRFGEERA
jgi:hypothetical protein